MNAHDPAYGTIDPNVYHIQPYPKASALYEAYDLERLPAGLRRNSLDYYYLSIYPSLSEMQPLPAANHPAYPATIHNIYIHVPFCSGVCEFCSYYLVAISPAKRERISRYLNLVKRELAFHTTQTELDITYLYFGGGTPSLMPVDALESLLAAMAERGWLSPSALGTLELHPEFFDDPQRAERFLDTLRRYGISRVSVGYQVSDDHLLSATKRRHQTAFIAEAMSLLRDKGFIVNLDLMYGLADQSLASWEATLHDGVRLEPDSLSTYFLFVDQGTITYEKVRRGRYALPTHRHVQTQHIMAQVFLEQQGYWELPNDFYARGVAGGLARQERLPSSSVTLPIGPGAYGYYSNTQLANTFDLVDYERRIRTGRSPLWRGYVLSPLESFHRDIMFSFKNDPYLDCSLFLNHYNWDPLQVFQAQFEQLVALDLVLVQNEQIRLTAKGRLCVEEISSLFRHPGIRPHEPETPANRDLLLRHNFAPNYPTVQWESGLSSSPRSE